jgi:hypothetical protein
MKRMVSIFSACLDRLAEGPERLVALALIGATFAGCATILPVALSLLGLR